MLAMTDVLIHNGVKHNITGWMDVAIVVFWLILVYIGYLIGKNR